MLKWLFWLIIVLVFWGISRSRTQARSSSEGNARPSSRPNGNVMMVPCAFCQVHVPQHEVLLREGKNFCSEGHYLQWKQSA